MGEFDPVRNALKTASVPGRDVTDPLIDAALGHLPWPVVAARILRLNPMLDPDVRLGSLGGLCMVPVDEALYQLQVDPFDPWSSFLHLCWRLRIRSEARFRSYSRIWTEVFGPAPIPGFPHLWTPCLRQSAPDLRNGLALARRIGVVPALVRGEGAEPFFRSLDEYDTWCRFQELWYLPSAAETEFSRRGRVYTGSREIVAFGAREPERWPERLRDDWGFWALVVAEEMPGSQPGAWTAVWEALGVGRGGLPVFLAQGQDSLTVLFGNLMTWHGVVPSKGLSLAAQYVVDSGTIRGDTEQYSSSAVQGHLAAGRAVLASAYPNRRLVGTGADPLPPRGVDTDLEAIFAQTGARVDPEAYVGSGGIRVTPPDPGVRREVEALESRGGSGRPAPVGSIPGPAWALLGLGSGLALVVGAVVWERRKSRAGV